MEDERYRAARARVRTIKDFYKNLFTYLAVNVLLIVINLLTSPDALWFYWVTLFWGFGIVLHASKVFVFKDRFFGKDWEERKIKELMEKENRRQ
jgi:hypothetical protein